MGGLEPPIFGLGDRRLIHWATRADTCLKLVCGCKKFFLLLLNCCFCPCLAVASQNLLDSADARLGWCTWYLWEISCIRSVTFCDQRAAELHCLRGRGIHPPFVCTRSSSLLFPPLPLHVAICKLAMHVSQVSQGVWQTMWNLREIRLASDIQQGQS